MSLSASRGLSPIAPNRDGNNSKNNNSLFEKNSSSWLKYIASLAPVYLNRELLSSIFNATIQVLSDSFGKRHNTSTL